MLLADLCDYLTSQAGFVQGTDLFYGVMPPDPDTAVALYETGGLSPVRGMGNTAGDHAVERPRVEAVSRAESYSVARANAQRVFLKLDGMPAVTLNGVRYKFAQAVQSPFLMGRDAQERVLVACNYDVIKEASTTS